jgi:hypothetical protein
MIGKLIEKLTIDKLTIETPTNFLLGCTGRHGLNGIC